MANRIIKHYVNYGTPEKFERNSLAYKLHVKDGLSLEATAKKISEVFNERKLTRQRIKQILNQYILYRKFEREAGDIR